MSKVSPDYIIGGKFSMLGNDRRHDLDHFTGGGAVAELEKKLADFYGMKHAICTASATTALFSLGLALELRDADFITPPLNFGGSITPWLLLGNRPIFADVDPVTLTLDPSHVEEQLITNKTRAILAVDLYGYPSDTESLRRAANEFGLWYIADAAQAFGAKRGGKLVSYMADAVVLSFNSQKSLAAGEGGCIITDNADLYERLVWYSQHPLRQKRELGVGIYNEFSFNTRIHPAAAVSALASFDGALLRVAEYQELCLDALAALEREHLIEPARLSDSAIRPSFFALTTRPTSDALGCVRYLYDHGIEASTHRYLSSVLYKNPVYLHQFGKQHHLENACKVAEEAITRMTLSSLRRAREI